MSALMVPEPLEIEEYHFAHRGYYVQTAPGVLEWRQAPPLLIVHCPAWGCEWTCNSESMPYLWLEHLRSHRFTPFTMEKPNA